MNEDERTMIYPAFSTLVYIGTLVVFVLFNVQESVELQLATMLLLLISFVLALVSVYYGFKKWRNNKIKALYPTVLFLLCVFASVPLAEYASDVSFEKNLDNFESIVSDLKALHYVVGEKKRTETKGKYAGVGYAIDSWYEGQDFLVMIWWGGGLPVKHTCYVYSEEGSIQNVEFLRKNFRRGRKMNSNWFRVSD